ncbi:MAG: helix-turn-helix domain-containing protein [Gammaproteobacteria bacterium]|nr:helix-turn-helix domain-containing protein [Gammaproteobacteria bacterium]MYI67315.1 helix-turn-helix domain-containing protein [Boseongicola sp. SB0673_bin_14]
MPRPTRIANSPPAAVEEALERLGRNIRTARLRRKLPQADLAARMGVSRFVVADVERGKPTTGVAVYLGALWALDLLGNMRKVADPDLDEEGKTLERARGPKRAGRRRGLSDDF